MRRAGHQTIAYLASFTVSLCSQTLKPMPTDVASCFPAYFGYTDTAFTIYNRLQTADLVCQYASDCATATYTVGDEPTATATPALQNPGFGPAPQKGGPSPISCRPSARRT